MKKLFIFCLLWFFVAPCFAEKIVIFYKSDKSVIVRYPVYKTKKSSETEEDFLRRVAESNNEAQLLYDIAEKSDLPSDEYRNAWEGEKGKMITINQEKKEKIEQERKSRDTQ